METPFIRAKAKDSVEGLDNLTAYLDSNTKAEVVEYVRSTLGDITVVLAHASNNGMIPSLHMKHLPQNSMSTGMPLRNS